MVSRRKGITAAQSKITSHRMRSATLGTHVPRRSSRHMNGDSVGFSSPRKQKRAQRGYVDTILPTTNTRESASQYSRRVSRREFTQEIQRRALVRRIGVLAVCALLVVGIAVGVGAATFVGSLDAKLSLKNSDVASALVAPKADAAYYTVIAADLDEPGSAGAVDGPDAVALVRVDQASRAVSVVSVPPTLQVSLKDGKTHMLREASTLEGDASLVKAVASSAGVDVAHFVKIDAAGLKSLVDTLGGVEVNVAEEVDDPTAGDVYLPTGTQTLDGRGALTLARASNFADAATAQAANQRALLTAIAQRLLGSGSFDFLSIVDKANGAFGTDLGALDALSVADALRGFDPASVTGALMPGYKTTRENVDYYVASSDAWKSMMQRVQNGEDPAVQDEAPTVDPGGFTLTIRNGGGITGAASQMAETLKAQGFDVAETGNTDTSAYNETLVVYNDDANAAAAQTVVSALGLGRTVAGSSFYTFDTDVLLILGKDWKPAA